MDQSSQLLGRGITRPNGASDIREQGKCRQKPLPQPRGPRASSICTGVGRSCVSIRHVAGTQEGRSRTAVLSGFRSQGHSGRQQRWSAHSGGGLWTVELVSGQWRWSLDSRAGLWTMVVVSGQWRWSVDSRAGLWTAEVICGQWRWSAHSGGGLHTVEVVCTQRRWSAHSRGDLHLQLQDPQLQDPL